MEFALLGADDESLALARAARHRGHPIVWAGDLGCAGEDDRRWLAAGQASDSDLGDSDLDDSDMGDRWEALLDSSACDAVLVGRGAAPDEQRTEQLIQLARAGRAVLTTFPVVDSVLAYYEIDMARSDGKSVFHHFNPCVEFSELIDDFSKSIRNRDSDLGVVEQIVFMRPLANRVRDRVLWHFARDVELLGRVAGRLDRLGAFGSPDEEATYAGLSVQLLGESRVPVRWEVEPAAAATPPRLVLIASDGKRTSLLDEAKRDGQSATDAAALVAIDRFVDAVETDDWRASTWPDALRAMELADTIEISLRRGRMIDIHRQELTEQLAFKGMMSAVGCAALMVLPPLLLAVGWLADLAGLGIASYWPHVLLAFFALFLVFQLVGKLFLGDTEHDTPSDSRPSV